MLEQVPAHAEERGDRLQRRVLRLILACMLVAACAPPAPTPRNKVVASNDKKGKKSTDTSDDDPLTEIRRGPSGAPEGAPEPAPPSAPATCTKDSECGGTGRICEGAHCIKGCRDNAGCSTGQLCADKACVKATSTAECTEDAECDLGKICTEDACVAGCHSTYDCPLQQMCSAAGQCVPESVQDPSGQQGQPKCTSDGQCNPGNNGSGKICSAAGACVPGCRKDIHCPDVRICVGGTCQ